MSNHGLFIFHNRHGNRQQKNDIVSDSTPYRVKQSIKSRMSPEFCRAKVSAIVMICQQFVGKHPPLSAAPSALVFWSPCSLTYVQSVQFYCYIADLPCWYIVYLCREICICFYCGLFVVVISWLSSRLIWYFTNIAWWRHGMETFSTSLGPLWRELCFVFVFFYFWSSKLLKNKHSISDPWAPLS